MIIGTVKETKTEEYRVALTPDGVADIVRAGHEAIVETGAGVGSNYHDAEYARAGAEVVTTPDEVYARADLMCEVKEPQPSEFSLLREGQLLFTYLHLAAEPEVTDALVDSGCIAIGYETVRRDDGFLPLLAPMSEIAGRMAVEVGGHHLKRPGPGRGVLLGGSAGRAAGAGRDRRLRQRRPELGARRGRRRARGSPSPRSTTASFARSRSSTRAALRRC